MFFYKIGDNNPNQFQILNDSEEEESGSLSTTGIITNIQRFSIHDGPGIRTTVFLKGCTLRCFWCHNPETLRPRLELQFAPTRCIGCQACVEVCPQRAHTFQDGIHIYDRSRCTTCGRCTDVCYAGALELSGREITGEDVMREVLADLPFYETSGGGITLSGGEPLLQPAFAKEILRQSKAENLHTAIETAANYPWDTLADVLPLIDLVMMDLKHMDPTAHQTATGVSNALILGNARRLAQTGKPIIFRTPVIPTINDSPQAITAIAQFIRALPNTHSENGNTTSQFSLDLLPFHRLATDKYHNLGLDYRASQLEPPSKETMAELTAAAQACGITAHSR